MNGGGEADIKPAQTHDPSVQIDEVWNYVGKKKSNYWLLYADSPEFDEVTGYVCGNRDPTTVRALIKKLSKVEMDVPCTDL